MARQYKFEITRNSSVTAEMYVHEDDSLELTSADSGKPAEYLIDKLIILRDLYKWMRKYEVHSAEIVEV